MIERALSRPLRDRLGRHPAVALVRFAAGRKDDARAGPGRPHFDLEQPGDRTRLDVDWDGVFAARDLVVLDEAQAWPAVLPRLRGAVNADRKRNGRFLLLGSVWPARMTHVSESLSGRLSILELSPFVVSSSNKS